MLRPLRHAAVLVLFLALAAAAPAAAQTVTASEEINAAARALKQSPVYVAPDADPALTPAQADRLKQEIRDTGAGPMYIAVLGPNVADAAGGSLEQVLVRIHAQTGERGTYVVVAGRSLQAGSDELRRGGATRIAREVLGAHQGDTLFAVLSDFVRRVGAARRAGSSGGGGGGGIGAGVLLIPLALGGGLLLLRARRNRRAQAEQLEEVREAASDDVVSLGEEIRDLDIDVDMPGTPASAKETYSQALDAYERAGSALPAARRPQDMEDVSSAVEEGRWAIRATRAHLIGEAPPERRPPCFFDPRHGPSVADVEWAPPGGTPREVPACAADVLAVEQGQDPQMREVMVGGQRTPYWNAGPAYRGWAGGFYGGGLLPGLFLGSMLGGGGIWGGGWGDGGDGGGGDGGGGDFGGGGFGGGDFGGGGGDFGGGGGDF